MTTSTSGRSRPRAATSVAKRIDGADGSAAEFVKFASVFVRALGGRCPCREYSVDFDGRSGAMTYFAEHVSPPTRIGSQSAYPIEVIDACACREVDYET